MPGRDDPEPQASHLFIANGEDDDVLVFDLADSVEVDLGPQLKHRPALRRKFTGMPGYPSHAPYAIITIKGGQDPFGFLSAQKPRLEDEVDEAFSRLGNAMRGLLDEAQGLADAVNTVRQELGAQADHGA